jgi:hypothetical protein
MVAMVTPEKGRPEALALLFPKCIVQQTYKELPQQLSRRLITSPFKVSIRTV